MMFRNIPLWERNVPGLDLSISDHIPSIDAYPVNSVKPHPAVIVLPGGGYFSRVNHEKSKVCEWLNSIGISAFIAQYRVSPYKHPCPSIDARRAIRWVRSHADDFNIDKNRVGVIGFSAGGHLAATIGTCFNDDGFIPRDGIDKESSRPDALILCYAVISFLIQTDGNLKTLRNLAGENPSQETIESLSLELQVTDTTPPAFIWSTGDDELITVENSLRFAMAMHKINRPYALHVFPHGRHGLSLSGEVKEVAQWTTLCEAWLRSIGF